jgi:hypothetical protein
MAPIDPRMPAALDAERHALRQHPLAGRALTLAGWRVFMAHHVFAVWDFMSLLKRLQAELAPVALPWRPPAHPQLARLINAIVLAEESDQDGAGGHASHFEQYVRAMAAAGADAGPIQRFTAALARGVGWPEALEGADVPAGVRPFVTQTLTTALHAPIHEVAAAFFYGREEVLPVLFGALGAQLDPEEAALAPLAAYFARHIELDGEDHGPMAQHMLAVLCRGEPDLVAEAQAAAQRALCARRALWDAALGAMAAPVLPSA